MKTTDHKYMTALFYTLVLLTLTTPVSSNEESELLSFNKNNWYFGIGLGESKHEYTESDLEFTGLDNQVVDFSDNAGKIFAGYKASNSFFN